MKLLPNKKKQRLIMIHKLYITYESICPFLSPLLSQCAAVKTNLGAISDPAHIPRLNDKKVVFNNEVKFE